MKPNNIAKTMPEKKDKGHSDLQLLSDSLGDSFMVKEDSKGNIIVRLKKERQGIKSEVNSSAHFTKQCNTVSTQLDNGVGMVSAVSALKDIDKKVWCIAVIQLVSGARISEVLSLDYRNVLVNGTIVLRGRKRSSDRIVSCGEAYSYLEFCKANCVQPFEGLNRFYVYRVYKKAGLILPHGENEKNSVTHALRHLYISEAKKVTDTATIQSQIGHKSINSTNHYVNKDKK